MNPFEQPPAGSPVSSSAPAESSIAPSGGSGGHDGPRRGRMALAALAAAGLVGGGIVVGSQFVAADDRPSLDAPAPEQSDDERRDEDRRDDERRDAERRDDERRDGEGQRPALGELGELGDCLGPILRGPILRGPMSDERDGGRPFDDEFHERMEQFLEDLPWDELGELDGALDDGVRIFGSGGSTVTVVGPDGVQVIDLGDGDATVTIEQRDDELSIDTDGDATVTELPDLRSLVPHPGGPGALDDLDLDGVLPFDLDELESCLDDLDGPGPAGS